jgi:hypothetical protein
MGKRARNTEIPDTNQDARDAEVAARQEADTKRADTDRQIGAAIGNRNQEQVDRRNQIAARADEQVDREFQEFDGDKVVDPDPSEQAERDAARAAREAEEERERLEAEANERAARDDQEGGAVHAEPRKFKLKVNGRDVELTEEEVLARASKVSSADEYLQLASRAVEASQALGPSKDVSAGNGEDVTEDTLTSALQGDPEAIKKVAQRLRAPPVVTPDVLTAVDDRMSFRSAVDWFRGEYRDVVEDPMLYRLVVDEDTRLTKTEPTLAYRERLKRAGETVRTWKQGLAKSAAANPKLERKASVASIPQAGGRQAVREDSEEEEPIESTINKMALARHQQGAIRKQ